jgi:hypothetical protein
MANQVKTPIQNYFEKVLYGNLAFEIPPLGFFKSRVKKKNRNKPLWSGHTSVSFENASAFIVKRESCLKGKAKLVNQQTDKMKFAPPSIRPPQPPPNDLHCFWQNHVDLRYYWAFN